MEWSDYYNSLITMLQVQDPDGQENLNTILMRLIDETELYLFRHPKLDFLATRTVDRTQQTAPATRLVPIPKAFVVVDDVYVLIPHPTIPNILQRIVLLRVSRPWLDAMFTNVTITRTPKKYETYYAIDDMNEIQTTISPPPSVPTAGIPSRDSSIFISPPPDAAYTVEYHGTFRPAPFYTVAGFDPSTYDATVQFAQTPSATSFLSSWFPDLYLAASLVFGSGYQKNFGSQSDNPQQAMSWMADLERLIDVASSEEFRKKAMDWSWGARPEPAGAMMQRPAGGGGAAVPPVGAAAQ
jgi:hypothetical protein